MSKRVFVTGVFGAGKSTICERVARDTLFCHLKAGELIYKFLKQPPPHHKAVADVERNQDALLLALRAQNDSGKNYLLEGHSCLLNTKGDVERVPLRVFHELRLTGIVMVARDLHFIQQALLSRDQVEYQISVLERLQNEERRYAKQLAEAFKIPYLSVDLDEVDFPAACKRVEAFLTCQRAAKEV